MRLSLVSKSKKDLFVSLFQQLRQASDIVTLHFEANRLYLQGMDRSHVTLFETHIDAKWFQKYELETPHVISVDTNSLFQVLTICHESQAMILSSTNSEHIHIDFMKHEEVTETSEKKKTKKKDKNDPSFVKTEKLEEKEKCRDFEKHFKLPLTDYDAEMLDVPETEYDVDISLPAKKLQELTHQLALFGDTVVFTCTEDTILLSSMEGTHGEMNVSLPMEDILEYSINEGEIIDTSFGLSMLNKICIHNKLTDNVTLSLKQHYPMRIRYDMEEKSFIQFYIAPKVTE